VGNGGTAPEIFILSTEWVVIISLGAHRTEGGFRQNLNNDGKIAGHYPGSVPLEPQGYGRT